ncbi:NrfD/PsrC family molybdoenzyme membrane anchor subunit [Leucothrix arctica]|uniref:Molybdopterin oxidoreductase n=1 Tax=Leucothrix arctica TaxID=1481894 RepID=A0A317CIG3_9GAMM|nr:NrfD/PsrC family molybdoenzyme membrane anchor subunit [Leucothrix arctica]PWQ98348.1 molybdopterin oxidoreductase [Leucothrix arctica]
MQRTDFHEIEISSRRFYSILVTLAGVLVAAAYAFFYMESQGHFVTGMNNQVVWGLPHVVAIFLIVTASGAANVASLGSVFNKPAYQPYGRISLVLAMSLLLGGLLVILLDLGHADRLIIAMTHFNFDSVFAWNILLYSGFFVIMGLYLWSIMDRTATAKRCYQPLAYLGFVWRFILTAGTGSIFGVLVAREYYDILMMAPLFIASSYLIGTACFSLVLLLLYKLEGRQLSEVIKSRLAISLCLCIVVVTLIELARHLLNYFIMGYTAVEVFVLRDAGAVTLMFWLGQVVIGLVLPIILLYLPSVKRSRLAIASTLIMLGGLCQLYVIIIGGQLQPLRLFPNAVTETSGNLDIAYSASLPELMLSLGGVAITLFVFTIAVKVLRLTPANS